MCDLIIVGAGGSGGAAIHMLPLLHHVRLDCVHHHATLMSASPFSFSTAFVPAAGEGPGSVEEHRRVLVGVRRPLPSQGSTTVGGQGGEGRQPLVSRSLTM